MDLGLKNRRVLVTGGSQGIGAAIAMAFAAEGARVAVTSRRGNVLEEVVTRMGGTGKGHAFYAADLMEPGKPTETVTALTADDDPFDIVIHNVGGTLQVKDPLSPAEQWQQVWQFNAGIAIEINRSVVPPMRKKGWGRIIHISSISAESVRGSAPYAAAKAYLNAYVKGVGRAWAEDGIVASALMPGALYAPGGHWDGNSEINRDNQDAFFRKRSDFLRHHHAVGRLGTADEIAPFALFLASEQATFAQASIVPVDGGTM